MSEKNSKRLQSWEVSDALWELVAPLIPKRKGKPKKQRKRKVGGGRKPLEARRVFTGIVFVLRTGIQWKALPRDYGAASSVHQYFQEWERAGVFEKLWVLGVELYDRQRGIKWAWQSIDGAKIKAPMGDEAVGRNPTDRGKKWHRPPSAGG
jgi:transposase